MTGLPAEEAEGLLREIQQIGLRAHDARVLLALLHAGTANSRQLAELTGVRRTSIYKAAQALTRLGLSEPVPTHGAMAWTSPGWAAVLDILDAAAEERLRRHRERTTRFRQILFERDGEPTSE